MSGERIETTGEYTPTTDEVRDSFAACAKADYLDATDGDAAYVRAAAAFDRWFAQVAAEAEARGAGEALLAAADDELAEAKRIRDAYRAHNTGRRSEQREHRPDLGWWADATEAVSHRIRSRATQTGADR